MRTELPSAPEVGRLMRCDWGRTYCATVAARLLVAGLAALLVGCGTLKEAKLNVPTWFGLEEIAPGVYASPEVTAEQRAQLRSSIQKAMGQAIEVYGAVVSSPVVYACADRRCYESFNGYGDGRAVGPTGILLLPKSFIPEAIGHEWSHVELYTRVGRAGYRQVPMWFHEGLAVVVSRLPQHSEETLRQAERLGLPIPPDIKALGALKVWSQALKQYHNDQGLNVMYAAAGQEVREWLSRAGTGGLQELIDAINAGEGFMVAYERIGAGA